EFDQYGTVRAIVLPDQGSRSTSFRLQPGETVDCYIDMRMTGTQAMGRRMGSYLTAHTGVYNDLDRFIDSHTAKYRMSLYSGDFADYRMTGEEYKDMVKARYDALTDSIARADAPRMWKEYSLLALQNDVLEAMARYQFLLAHNYQNVYDQWDPNFRMPEDSIRALMTPGDYAEVTTWFDMTNPKLLLGGAHIGDMDWGEYGVKGDLSRSIGLYAKMADKAAEMKLEPIDLEQLRTLSNPFYAAACDSINQRAIRETQRLAATSTLTPTPDVPVAEVFDAIIAPYKGKVVVVDLWNTWCGPCRAAIKHHEPLKAGALSDEDIVWIYIADESSDPVKYLQMLPDIKGIHYKLTQEQYRALGSRFKVDGIPFYILVDREGNAQSRPDMRADATFVNAIKSKL
ncbi:MAG: TlpA family protein disulfide reductase, partial [Duncaniella sp.]|nr:TlpA family protein disulfide reductase [Duncaniella sp.]